MNIERIHAAVAVAFPGSARAIRIQLDELKGLRYPATRAGYARLIDDVFNGSAYLRDMLVPVPGTVVLVCWHRWRGWLGCLGSSRRRRLSLALARMFDAVRPAGCRTVVRLYGPLGPTRRERADWSAELLASGFAE